MHAVFPVRLILLLLCTLSSSITCTSFKGTTVQDTYLNPEYTGRVPKLPISIGEVQVSKALDAPKVREDSVFILSLFMQKRSKSLGTQDQGQEPLTLEVKLKEESLLKDFQRWNTITAELTLKKGQTLVLTSLIAEETKATLSSYPYLYNLLRQIWGRVP
ncbi:MAG: hypothetical protein SNJ78_07535 [Spirochaetales bacterium]